MHYIQEEQFLVVLSKEEGGKKQQARRVRCITCLVISSGAAKTNASQQKYKDACHSTCIYLSCLSGYQSLESPSELNSKLYNGISNVLKVHVVTRQTWYKYADNACTWFLFFNSS